MAQHSTAGSVGVKREKENKKMKKRLKFDGGRPLLNQYTRQFVAGLAKVLMLLKE